ncbi:MAG: hypothetical protein ACFFCS_29780, partial [Candidatus Hodarchaeota archaeon]
MKSSDLLLEWIKNSRSSIYRGVDVDSETNPGNFPEIMKTRNRIISKRPDGLTIGNSSIFSVVGLCTVSLIKYIENYYTTNIPNIESWSMDSLFFLTGPERTRHWLSENPLNVQYWKTSLGWQTTDLSRDFSDLAGFRDKYLEQPRRTGMSHGIFSNPELTVHVLDFAPIEPCTMDELPRSFKVEDLWMVDDPPAKHHGCLVRVYLIENKTTRPISDPTLFVRFKSEGSPQWHVVEDEGKESIWLVDNKTFASRAKNENSRFAWEVFDKMNSIEDYEQFRDVKQFGGIGIFSSHISGHGEWKESVEEDFLDDDFSAGKLPREKKTKKGYFILKPNEGEIPPGGHVTVPIFIIPARNGYDLARISPLLSKDPYELLLQTEKWWNLFLDTRAARVDDRAVQDFLETGQIMNRLHYGPGDLSIMLTRPPNKVPGLGRLAGTYYLGNEIAPRAIGTGSVYYDVRSAFVRDNYWIAKGFLASGRLEEYMNNSLYFAEAFRIDGIRNA